MTRSFGLALALALALTGCGGDGGQTSSPDDPTSSPPAAGACLEGAEDCEDVPGQPAPPPDDVAPDDGATDEAAIIAEAEAMLGEPEDEVLEGSSDVRLGRHGDEQFALTEDYVIGRKTIATDDDGTGTYRVVEVTIELTDGPVTVTDEGT